VTAVAALRGLSASL